MTYAIDTGALVLSLSAFALGCLVAWLLKRFQITDSVGLIVLILLPVATYGVATGFIKKITTPGGWAAEFREVAAAEIRPTLLVDEVDDLAIVEKGGLDRILSQREAIQPGQPIAIVLTLGRQNYYNASAIQEYIRAFLTLDPDLTVIFQEQSDRFAASANANSVLAALQLDDYAPRFLRAIEESDLLALRRLVVLTTNAVHTETTNAEALQLMLKDGVDSMVKVDERGVAKGIVRRDQIVSHLMVQLAS